MFPRQLKYLRNGGSLSRKCFTTKGKNVFLFFILFVKGDMWPYQNGKKKKKDFTEWVIVHDVLLRVLK